MATEVVVCVVVWCGVVGEGMGRGGREGYDGLSVLFGPFWKIQK